MEQNQRFYQGRSMAGTFRPGDFLYYEKIPFHALKAGDIIVFKLTNEKEKNGDLVHRIIRRSAEGLITRGDNNPAIDQKPVTAENLIGRITHFERKGRRYLVHGGARGLLRARLIQISLKLRSLLKRLFKKPYRFLLHSGLVRKLWHPRIQELHFQTEKGLLIKYVNSGRTVALWWQDQDRFWFRRPYDLILREKLCARQKKEYNSR